jgi:hypothetical protein
LSKEETGRYRIGREDVKHRLITRKSPNSSDIPDPIVSPADESQDGISEDDPDKDKDRLSVLTALTDSSVEMATIQKAEKRTLTSAYVEEGNELGLLSVGDRLQFDFGSKFGLGGFGVGNDGHDARQPETIRPATYSSAKRGSNMKMGTEEIDVDMEMRSALDRLMEDVAGRRVDDSKSTGSNEEDNSYPNQQEHPPASELTLPNNINHADSALLHDSFASRNPSSSSSVNLAPPVPPKDNIRNREQMIIEKRREARRMEESEGMGYYTPPKVAIQDKKGQQHLGVGRPSRRRSMSTGDAEALRSGGILLDLSVGREMANDDPLGDTIEKELKKWDSTAHKSVRFSLLVMGEKLTLTLFTQKYFVREREGTIYASSSDPDCISHMAGPGDVNAGKAWRPVRRPSDMVNIILLLLFYSDYFVLRMNTQSRSRNIAPKKSLVKHMARFSLKVRPHILD